MNRYNTLHDLKPYAQWFVNNRLKWLLYIVMVPVFVVIFLLLLFAKIVGTVYELSGDVCDSYRSVHHAKPDRWHASR
jgi:uncharacterized BrkB/YihY/UPF0761 family membrane protein